MQGVLDLLPADSPPSFSVLALGTGGGPTEDNLSAYWVKPAQQSWNQGFISVDGGALEVWLAPVSTLLMRHPHPAKKLTSTILEWMYRIMPRSSDKVTG